ncbi:hypothetical protein [Estrella lausannensis]|uniref:Putative secreted protein n=1 Tax=Estrella lausannensis TaxID=483423 RepID=A0A0H5DN80_9BACT|nr:hypothetical protein [Estrella lausannensis]CRX37726.1 putative secreted protein [Estrella lausannensis]
MSVFKKCKLLALVYFLSFGAPGLQASWTPTQFFTVGDTGASPDVGVDPGGNAIAVFVNTGLGGVIEASQFDPETNTWGTPFQISIPQETGKDAPAIGMSEQNLAYVIQRDQTKPAIEFSQLNQSGWNSGIAYSDSGTLSKPSIAASGTGQFAAAWISSVNGVQALAINGVSLSALQVLDSSATSTTDLVSVAVNNSGTAVAAWLGSNGNIRYSLYSGGVWSPALDVTSEKPNQYPSVGIDDSGNVVFVWKRESVIWANQLYKGQLFHSQKISNKKIAAVSGPLCAVDKTGIALSIWLDEDNNVAFSYFDGKEWSHGVAGIAEPTSVLSLTKDDNKNFFAEWSYNAGSVHEIRSAYFNPGLGWSQTETAATSSLALRNPRGALSSLNHTAFAVFESGGNTDAAGTFSLLAVPPSPPAEIQGRVKKDRFPCQTDRIHIVSWSATDDPTAVAYRFREGTKLVGQFPLTGPFRLDFHNRDRKKEVTYKVSTVNSLGVEGAPITIELR